MPKEGQAHRALLALEFPGLDDFDDPGLEMAAAVLRELFGTFLLVLVGAGGGGRRRAEPRRDQPAAAVTAPGLMVMAIILFMGAVSGAHLNPASRSPSPPRRLPVAARTRLRRRPARRCDTRLPVPAGRVRQGRQARRDRARRRASSDWQAMLIELVLTVGPREHDPRHGLARRRTSAPLSAVAVGGYIALAGLWSSPISGASMNPAARSARTWCSATSAISGSISSARSGRRSSRSASPGFCAGRGGAGAADEAEALGERRPRVPPRAAAASASVSWPRSSRHASCPRSRRGGSSAPRCRGRARPAPGRSRAPRASCIASSIRPQCGSSGSRPGRARAARVRSERTSRPPCRCRACSCTTTWFARWFAGACGLPRVPPNAQCSTTMPGRPSSSRSRQTGGRDHAEVLGDQRQVAERALDRAEELGARAAAPAAVARGRVPLRDRPVRDEAAEVVDPREVDELERRAGSARSTSGSPSRDARASRRAGCPSAARSRSARPAARPRPRRARRARGHACDVGAVVGDVDRHVADQAHAARARVVAQRRPLALEAHLVGERAARRRSAPSRRSSTEWRATKSSISRSETGASGSARSRGERGERRRRAVRRAELVGRPERQHLPPGLPRGREPVDEPVRLGAEAAAGQRRRMQEDSGGARQLHAFDSRRSSKLCRSMPLPKTNEPPPRIQIQRVTPQIDCGRYPVKRTVGDRVDVTARHLPRRPREARRGDSLQAGGRDALAGGAARRRSATTSGRGRSPSIAAAAGPTASRRGSTGSPRSRTSCGARSTRAEGPHGRARRGRRPARP